MRARIHHHHPFVGLKRPIEKTTAQCAHSPKMIVLCLMPQGLATNPCFESPMTNQQLKILSWCSVVLQKVVNSSIKYFGIVFYIFYNLFVVAPPSQFL